MSSYSRDWNNVRVVDHPNSWPQEEGPEYSNSRLGLTLLILLTVAINAMVLAKINVPILRAAAGFWFILLLPAYLIYTTSAWRRCALQERLGYSVCAALLILMLAGLGINTILPFLGMKRPLGAYEILVTADLINLSLYIVRNRYPDKVRLHPSLGTVGREELRLLVIATLSVVLVVLGANRLNNGAGGQPTLLAMSLVALVILLSLCWLRLVRDAVLCAVIYLVSLSLLLSTSLRGWYITGHDIQDEYRVFQLTEAHGHWSMAYFHDAYNACLSITILPTELGQIINVDDPYIYKVFFQLIFALCPILVYGISRRYFGRVISVLSVAYFIGFPTFFTDMPFLNRQEIAYLFVAVAVLAATNAVWSFRGRQLGLVLAGLGVEISHYSSMYVFIGILIIGWVCCHGAAFLTRFRGEWLGVSGRRMRWAPGAGISVTIGTIIVLAGFIFVWGGLATGISGQALNDGQYAISAGSISFSNFGSKAVLPSVAIQDLRRATIRSRGGDQESVYLPLSAVSKASTPVVVQQVKPLTEIGRDFNSLGIPVVSINSLARNVVAYGEQLFLAIGLLRLLLVHRQQRRQIGQQCFWLCVGSVGVIGLITVLPSIAADYGAMRAFQQGLIFFAPVIVIGSITLFEPIGKQRAKIAAGAVCLGLFLCTSGLVAQILGGNLAELNLNNSGTYYNLYYTSPEDEAAVAWLGGQPDVAAYPIQTSYLQTKFLFTGLSDVNGKEAISDDYPTLVQQNSWLILGYPTVSSGVAYTFTPSNGALTEYKYPVGLLNHYKSLVYTNGSVVIYR